jgi:hypothetical protein
MKSLRLFAYFTIGVLAVSGDRALAQNRKASISPDDEKLLSALMKDFLFDPLGAQRVEAPATVRSVWGGAQILQLQGWLVQKNGETRVYFTDGASLPASPTSTKIDFLAKCKALYENVPKAKVDDVDPELKFAEMRRTAVGVSDDSDLVLAAWLFRIGEKELAANALSRVADRGKELVRVRKDLAWTAYAGMVHAYMVFADEEALGHGERLLRLYREEAKEYQQAEAVVRDLKRRKERGSFGKGSPTALPKEFSEFGVPKKVAFLIDALDGVDARQDGQPGGVDLAGDYRVNTLIKIGDPAVPALIDALDNDERFTRSVHYWRDFARSRTVLSVRETALVALMSILRIRVFETHSTGGNFTSQGEEAAKKAAKKLRDYWNDYGPLSFDERMMKTLTDPGSNFESLREAADNLACLGADRILGTTVWTDRASRRPEGPNPAVKKFMNPTAAEAILAAMDRDLARHDAEAADKLSKPMKLPPNTRSMYDKGFFDYLRGRLEEQYFVPVIELGDERIGPALAKRAESAEEVRMRRRFAYTSFKLKSADPIRKYSDDFAAGKISIPVTEDDAFRNFFDQSRYVELHGAVVDLSDVRTPEADRALFALADPKHPYHADVVKAVLLEPMWHQRTTLGWTDHPYCLAVLGRALDDPMIRDKAVSRLNKLVRGLPEGVDAIKDFLDRNRDKLRPADTAEERRRRGPDLEPQFVVAP